ncbi:hypothetical protein C8Q80DRAFT_1217698 [Daedaleopsis nitida]|nr:hypothetical protein C8Q80DRAFT_1217698 [Daedaleopsis nitida]
MFAVYTQLLDELTKKSQGWHFSAMHASSTQLSGFRIKDMVTQMEAAALFPWTYIAGRKQHVIISICIQSRDQHCNTFQSTIGIFLHACNTPEQVVKVLAHMGAMYSTQQLARMLLAAYSYDNLELLLGTRIPTIDKPGDGLLHLTLGILLRLEHGVTLNVLQCSRLFQLPDPEAFDAILITKLEYLPLCTMDLNQSTVAGNIEAIQSMFTQAGVGDPRHLRDLDLVGLTEYVTIIHSGLGTYEPHGHDHLQSVVFVMGLFHLKMAAANTLWCIYPAPKAAWQDETGFMKLQHELIQHILTLLQPDAWWVEVRNRKGFESLEDWAASSPSSQEIMEIADGLARDYVEGEGLDLYKLKCISEATRDEHKNCKQTLRFMHTLYFIYPEGLRQTIRLNILVNPSSKLNEFRAVDWIYTYRGEGSNYTKNRIILETVLRKFALSGISHAHGKKDMTRTFATVLEHIKMLNSNMYSAGCSSRYPVPDKLMEGAAMIQQEDGCGSAARENTTITGDLTGMFIQMDSCPDKMTLHSLTTAEVDCAKEVCACGRGLQRG